MSTKTTGVILPKKESLRLNADQLRAKLSDLYIKLENKEVDHRDAALMINNAKAQAQIASTELKFMNFVGKAPTGLGDFLSGN